MDEVVIGIKGAGEMASAVAWRLFSANIRRLFMMEIEKPLAIRRAVAFSEAVYEGHHTVEGVEAVRVENAEAFGRAWTSGRIPVIVDPSWESVGRLNPHGVVDAVLAKRNLGTHLREASLVIGLGPGFTAGKDVHFVVETQRGHDLGRIIPEGGAAPNTGRPGNIEGFTAERVLRSPVDGILTSGLYIGDAVQKGDTVALVGDAAIRASLGGVLRGLLRPGTPVIRGLKVGDIDPRSRRDYCFTLSDKARAIAGSVLEAVCRVFNRSGRTG